jgi:hypothetical protein
VRFKTRAVQLKLKDSAKIAGGLAFCIIARLALAPLPNVEPVMGSLLPFAKRYGALVGAVFAALALASIDFVTGRLGLWTLYCGVAYAAVGFAAGRYLPKFKERGWASRLRFAGFAAAGVVAYDAATALAFGLQFQQPLWATALAQIPFTALHLLGGVGFAFVASPFLFERFLAEENPSASATLA